jgi:Holliday junction resolvase RusA-like endonuclease
MATVKQYAEDAAAGRYFADGPLSLSVLAVYEWPKSVSARKRALPEARFKTSRPDLSNIAKLVEDALNGVVWHDDAQIASSRVQKVYGDRPRLLVLIEPLGAA